MKSSALPYWLAFAVTLVAVYGGYKVYQAENARPTGGVTNVRLPRLDEFELTDQSGQPFRSADMKGKVWVASFFFSTCSTSCDRLNANIKYLTTLKELEGVTWISITVDPETDTQGVLKAYAESRNADLSRWHFCRSDSFAYIRRVAGEVLTVGGVAYKGHNDYVVVVDRDGKIAGLFNGYNTDDLKKGVDLLKKCLAEKPQSATPSVESSDAQPSDAQTAAEST
jgi:cytochrome oxidase Cu insertion factor (SCO1/SenC/PrrC family)